MVRNVLAESNLEEYLNKLTKLTTTSVGLIIGQPGLQGKDYVVHLARTPKEESFDENNKNVANQSISGDFLVSNHALNVIRMLPAGFFIIGIFVVSNNNLFDDINDTNQVKLWISEIKSTFQTYRQLHASNDELDNGEMLMLHFNSTTKVLTCKSYEDKQGVQRIKPAECKFQEKITNWTLVESYYELDALFPIIRLDDKFNMEENFGSSLDKISHQIAESIVFFDGEILSDHDTLELILKNKKGKTEIKSIQATVYFPCNELKSENNMKIVKYDGTVHYHGMIASRVYAHPKNTIKQLQNFVKTDIMRSLSARIQIHCDALIDNNHIENHIIINEPPRRIFFPIKPTKIQFSDYIFRGEDDTTVIRQAKENLDYDLVKSDILTDIETLPDEIDEIHPTIPETDFKSLHNENKKKLYIGIIAAFMVLLISLILNFLWK